ncbi:hypothetical protein [Pedobacter sp. MW01-1-1]|uniref:hypothetical protein n=1 Tax=Pedobacter sp. MW01-1-1 TaxID=3383027 RepID=UPI003FEF3AB1
MKKIIYALVLPLIVVGGLALANREIKNESLKNPRSKPLSLAEREAEIKKWEASPDGVAYKRWVASLEGKLVYSCEAKIRKNIWDFSGMEAVVTSLSLPSNARLGFGMMVKINNDNYILRFGIQEPNEFKELRNLKVNDKIIIRSHNVSHAPKYLYPILSGDQIERDGKIIYKGALSKGGC